MLEIKDGEGILIGKQMFDIAEYAPKLDEEPFASDPSKKLSLPLKLILEDCPRDPAASLDILIVFDNQNKSQQAKAVPANVRDTMMMAMLGKYASANQAVKEQMKSDAQQQVRELLAKIEIANNKFAKEVAPNNKELSELDNRRLDLEDEIQISQVFIRKYQH